MEGYGSESGSVEGCRSGSRSAEGCGSGSRSVECSGSRKARTGVSPNTLVLRRYITLTADGAKGQLGELEDCRVVERSIKTLGLIDSGAGGNSVWKSGHKTRKKLLTGLDFN